MIADKIMAVIKLFSSAAYSGAPLLFGTTGEIVTEKSGSLNLGVEGTMAVGAIFGYIFACKTNSVFMGIMCAFLGAMLCGLLFAFLTVTLKANQNVTGLAMTIFGVGLYQLIGQTLKNKGTYPTISSVLQAKIANNGIPGLKDIPYIGELFFSYNILVYVGIVVAVICWIYMTKSKKGLQMLAIGENPGAADSVGIKVTASKYFNIMLGSGISGIGGLYMGLIINNGMWNTSWINGYGWISVALVIFANWSTARAIFGSLVFGLMIALYSKISVLALTFPTILGWTSAIPGEFFQMLPFLITAIILVVSSMRKRKNTAQPTACGVNYIREER